MYQSDYNPNFIRKQAFLAIFVFWFCACLVLYTVDKNFFESDYSSPQKLVFSEVNPADYYSSKNEFAKVALVSYENVTSGIAIAYSKFSSFLYMMMKDSGEKVGFFISVLMLLLPYFVAFLIMLSISGFLSVMKIVAGCSLSAFVVSFTIIFDSFAGNSNIDYSIAYSATQVSAYATVNVLMLFLLSAPFCFGKAKEV